MSENEALQQILIKVTSIDNRLEEVDNRLDKIDNRLDKLEAGQEKIQAQLDRQEQQQAEETKLIVDWADSLKSTVDKHERVFEAIRQAR